VTQSPEPWQGHVQRANLKGFSRLKAVLWPRSVRIAEICSLGHFSWYWRLRWNLWRGFSGIDLHDSSRLSGVADIFGETPILTVVRLIELARRLAPGHAQYFVDLGSGRGTTCLAAAALGYRGLGFEKETDWAKRSNAVAGKLAQECRFVQADFLLEPWPKSCVVFVVATAFDEELRSRILQRFHDLDAGSLLIAGDWALPGLEELWSGRLPVDWGVIPFALYRR